jgi:hypothetical protein
VTLTRLLLAWLPVTVWFVTATVATAPFTGFPSRPGEQIHWVGLPRSLFTWRLVEAGLLTLLASLWFDSLGTGAWWLVFLLVGAIATTPTWLALRPTDARRGRGWMFGASADLARYVLAGAILAWRLR